MNSTPSHDDVVSMLGELIAGALPDRTIQPDDPLIGPDAQLDSMELVSFVGDAQEAIFDRWQRDVVLADERALSRSKSPFRNLNALAEYIRELFDGH